jgi:hypothetical protein
MRGCRRHEPADPQCPTCTGRAARRIGRAILATNPRRLFAVTFDTTLSGNQFRSWRTAVRNLVDHQRRECRWWRQVAMQVWLGADGRLRGVVSLDAVTTDEFRDAFRRWSVSITSVKAGDLADAVYAAVEPGVVAHSGGQTGQAVRFTLKPQKVTSPLKRAGYCASQASHPEHAIEPMPCLFA